MFVFVFVCAYASVRFRVCVCVVRARAVTSICAVVFVPWVVYEQQSMLRGCFAFCLKFACFSLLHKPG